MHRLTCWQEGGPFIPIAHRRGGWVGGRGAAGQRRTAEEEGQGDCTKQRRAGAGWGCWAAGRVRGAAATHCRADSVVLCCPNREVGGAGGIKMEGPRMLAEGAAQRVLQPESHSFQLLRGVGGK